MSPSSEVLWTLRRVCRDMFWFKLTKVVHVTVHVLEMVTIMFVACFDLVRRDQLSDPGETQTGFFNNHR